MEDIVLIKLLFVGGLLMMAGVIAAVGYAIARFESRRTRARRGRPAMPPRRTVNDFSTRRTR